MGFFTRKKCQWHEDFSTSKPWPVLQLWCIVAVVAYCSLPSRHLRKAVMGAVMSYDVLHVLRVQVEGRLLLEVLLVDAGHPDRNHPTRLVPEMGHWYTLYCEHCHKKMMRLCKQEPLTTWFPALQLGSKIPTGAMRPPSLILSVRWSIFLRKTPWFLPICSQSSMRNESLTPGLAEGSAVARGRSKCPLKGSGGQLFVNVKLVVSSICRIIPDLVEIIKRLPQYQPTSDCW